MKVEIEGKIINLIQFKGDPALWWDGSDESKLYKWEQFRPALNASSLNSSYSASRLKIGVKVKGNVEGVNSPC